MWDGGAGFPAQSEIKWLRVLLVTRLSKVTFGLKLLVMCLPTGFPVLRLVRGFDSRLRTVKPSLRRHDVVHDGKPSTDLPHQDT